MCNDVRQWSIYNDVTTKCFSINERSSLDETLVQDQRKRMFCGKDIQSDSRGTKTRKLQVQMRRIFFFSVFMRRSDSCSCVLNPNNGKKQNFKAQRLCKYPHAEPPRMIHKRANWFASGESIRFGYIPLSPNCLSAIFVPWLLQVLM